jgi:hypothetical protein
MQAVTQFMCVRHTGSKNKARHGNLPGVGSPNELSHNRKGGLMDLPRVSRSEAAFMIGVPIAWAVLLLFHPKGEADEIYRNLEDQVTSALVVHIGMMLFIPLMAVVIYLLLRGVEGTAARVSRIALVPFVVFFSAWETLQGTANGILAHELNGRPEDERASGENLIQDFAENPLARDLGVFATIGSLAILIAMIAAGIALRRHAGAPLSVPILLGIFGLLIGGHPPPFGPIALVCFAVAVFLFWRSQPTALAPARAGQPSAA